MSRGTVWEVPILLAAVTGARRGKIFGIAWEDIDSKFGAVSIRRGVQVVRDSKRVSTVAFTPLKTKRSHRVVQLPPFALARIRRHRRQQTERRSASGAAWRDPLDELGRPVALVCDRGDGFFLYPDSFTGAFKRLARQAGMHPSTRLHDVRHAVATELGRRGVHPVIVSAVLWSCSTRLYRCGLSARVAGRSGRGGCSARRGALSHGRTVGNRLAGEAIDRPHDRRRSPNQQVRSVGRAGLEPATDGL